MGGHLTSLMSSSSSAGLQSMSISPQLVVAAKAIMVLLPSVGRGGRGGGARLIERPSHLMEMKTQAQIKPTLLFLLRHDAVHFVRF